MSISRRQFFRGLTGQGEARQRQREQRTLSIDTYVRTNLLPYDFALTADEITTVLDAVRAAFDLDDTDDLFTYERRQTMNAIAEETIRPWREVFWKAEEVRREASVHVKEFLSMEATPDERASLQLRFHIPYPAVLEEEIERQAQIWLSGLANSKIAALEGPALRELVFSELRSWC